MVAHVPIWKRLGWMVLIWAASVAVLAVIAQAIRLCLTG
ncbi:DUF2474 domain-containing protein [Mesorhizobium sp. DCY119]|nr:DUF2474 domain-containing protein [Mesorhizobium sp. DCY119]RJG41518.1 DUF2474 domain-containing protein [Mesorhizobium sp. DCY119]